ncbi:MAG TPA: YncE family protein [Vicinamibacterales bacterium]|nr:YncE family protein [Vicinamibacterales bacterium]
MTTHSTSAVRRGAVGFAALLIAAGTLSGGVAATGGLTGVVYVTDRSANRVWALDAADGSVLASNSTGERPIGVEKANGKVYTANETSGTMSVYEGCTLNLLEVIALPGCPRPHHTHTSSDGSRVYVACFGTNKIAVVNTETDTLEALWTSGGEGARTHQPWATKDDERVWATNTVSHDITELDADTGAILRRIPTRLNPIETVTPANSKLAYVSIPGQNKLQIFDLQTELPIGELDVPAPENLMISGNGKRILASTGGPRFPNTSASIVDTRTGTFTTIALPGTLATHNDLTNSGKYGFVSLEGPPHGLAVIDMDAAAVHAFYPIPASRSPHGVRWAPTCR